MYVSTFDGFFLFTQSTVGVLSLSSFSASFCSLDGAVPGPVLKAECEDEVAPLLVDGLGIFFG